MSTPKVPILVCYHCGNRTPHTQVGQYEAKLLYEQIMSERMEEPFSFFTLACGTCGGISVLGGFRHAADTAADRPTAYPRLFPRGPQLLPPAHTISPTNPIPEPVLRAYSEAWPLCHLNPPAFANQIRRSLEYVCQDRNAVGGNLAEQLKNLANRSVFPPELATTGDLLRKLGNIGSHANAQLVDVWDAELADELFCAILRYVYLVPAHVERMKERLNAPTVA